MNDWIRLKTPDFIDPRFLSKLPCDGMYLNDVIVVLNTKLRPLENLSHLKDGDIVRVKILSGHLYFKSVREIEEEKQLNIQKREQELKDKEDSKEIEINSNVSFNESLKIPVQWSVAQKDVMSGLSDSSSGDGRNSRTVNHVLLNEDLKIGKLERIPGEFLCTRDKGKRWSGQTELDDTNRVTCKRCIEIAKRIWSNNE